MNELSEQQRNWVKDYARAISMARAFASRVDEMQFKVEVNGNPPILVEQSDDGLSAIINPSFWALPELERIDMLQRQILAIQRAKV